MKFIMVDKGWEYSTEDGAIRIKKDQYRARQHKSEFATLDSYHWITTWNVYGLKDYHVCTFPTLAEAKRFIVKELEA